VIEEENLREKIKKAQNSKSSRRAKEGRSQNVERQGMGNRRWSSTEGKKDTRTRRGT